MHNITSSEARCCNTTFCDLLVPLLWQQPNIKRRTLGATAAENPGVMRTAASLYYVCRDESFPGCMAA